MFNYTNENMDGDSTMQPQIQDSSSTIDDYSFDYPFGMATNNSSSSLDFDQVHNCHTNYFYYLYIYLYIYFIYTYNYYYSFSRSMTIHWLIMKIIMTVWHICS